MQKTMLGVSKVVLLSLLLSWQGAVFAQKETKTPAVDIEQPMVSELIRHLVLDDYEDWAEDLDWKRLRKFYADRQFQPVWLVDELPSEKAEIWRDTLLRAGDEGLDPKEYHSVAIRYLWRARRDVTKIRLELLLTDAFFRYAIEARAGYQYPRLVDNEWYITPPKVHPTEMLNSVLTAQNMQHELDAIPPQHSGYQKLKKALYRYRLMLQQQGEWPQVPRGSYLKLGSWDYQVSLVRKRLKQEGYPLDPTPADEYLFDRDLEKAVKIFQHHTGEKPDGIVGPMTRYAMNLTVEKRIEQIIQNMERWRWLPHEMGKRYIVVNMAGYRLYVIENNETVLEMPVIIGKPYKATPAFANKVQYLEFNPTWNVPPSIARENFLPKIKEDSNFLKTNHIRIYENWKSDAPEVDPENIDWAEMEPEDVKFKFEQSAGEYNSLGHVKFMFPNDFRVYLHDTPSRTLFFQNVRTFSSGCIRVSRPVTLASYLMGEDNGWSKSEVRKLISRGETQRVNLKQEVPIYLLYWTSWVDDGDIVQFRRDIYRRNKNITSIAGDLLLDDQS